MLGKKTLKKQEFSLSDIPETKIKNKQGVTTWDAKDTFLDSQKVGAALLECLIENDTESFIEILDSYLRVIGIQEIKNLKL